TILSSTGYEPHYDAAEPKSLRTRCDDRRHRAHTGEHHSRCRAHGADRNLARDDCQIGLDDVAVRALGSDHHPGLLVTCCAAYSYCHTLAVRVRAQFSLYCLCACGGVFIRTAWQSWALVRVRSSISRRRLVAVCV